MKLTSLPDNNNWKFAKFTYFLCELHRKCETSPSFMKLHRFYETTSLFFLVSYAKVHLFLRKNMSFWPIFVKKWGFKKTVQYQKYISTLMKKYSNWQSFFITVLGYFWFWTVFLKPLGVLTFFFRGNLETLFTEIWMVFNFKNLASNN